MRGEIDRSKEGTGYIDFRKFFGNLTKELSGAYSVSDGIYSQKASISRFEDGLSINQANEFISHVEYDPDKAQRIIKDFANTHKPIRFYSGKDSPINLGVNIGSDVLLSLRPDSKANGRSSTIAVLVHRAAKLQSLLSPNGIPDTYTIAQGQANKALKLVEKAAEKAYEWNPAWGSLNINNAINEAKGEITKNKVAQGALVGVLTLAGCYMPTTPLSPIETDINTTSTVTEIVPTKTETQIPTPTVTVKPTQTEKPTATATETPTPAPYELSPVQMAEKNLFGSGFEIQAEFEGIPVDFTWVTSDGNLEQYNQNQGCVLNPKLAEYGTPSEDRIAKSVFLGHYVGYLRDNDLKETQYSFDNYIDDLKSGRDMSYSIYGVRFGQDDGNFIVDPLKPVEFVVTESKEDPNGRGTALLNDNKSWIGYIQLENGGLRIVFDIASSGKNTLDFCISSTTALINSYILLGSQLTDLWGAGQVTYPVFNYRNTEDELNKTLYDLKIYYEFNGKISCSVVKEP